MTQNRDHVQPSKSGPDGHVAPEIEGAPRIRNFHRPIDQEERFSIDPGIAPISKHRQQRVEMGTVVVVPG